MVQALERMAGQETGARQETARKFADALGQRLAHDITGIDVPPALAAQVTQVKQAEARYREQRDIAALDQALSGWEQILAHPALAEAPSVTRLGLISDAGRTYVRRYQAHGLNADLDRGLELAAQAVQEAPSDAPSLPVYLANLGSMLRMRYVARGNAKDVEDAIVVFRAALGSIAGDSPYRLGILNNLASSLRARYERTAQPTDLDEAIDLHQSAVALSPKDSPDLPSRLSNLGAGLSARFQAAGRLPDLDAAIDAFRGALAVAAENMPGVETPLNNLGLSLRYRYERTGRREDLQESITVLRRAVVATPEDSPDLPRHLNNLGSALSAAAQLPGQEEALAEAVHVMRRAVELTPASSTELPRHLAALGGALIQALDAAGEPQAGSTADSAARQDESVEVLRRALALAPETWTERPSYESNLGVALLHRYTARGEVEDRIEAEAAFLSACRRGLEVTPGTAILAAANWGNWELQRHAWPEAITAYGYGLTALNRLLRAQAARTGKESWLRDASRMPAAAAYARARVGDLRGAIAVLEAGRARLLAEALEQNRRDLDRLPALGQGAILERYRTAAARGRVAALCNRRRDAGQRRRYRIFVGAGYAARRGPGRARRRNFRHSRRARLRGLLPPAHGRAGRPGRGAGWATGLPDRHVTGWPGTDHARIGRCERGLAGCAERRRGAGSHPPCPRS